MSAEDAEGKRAFYQIIFAIPVCLFVILVGHGLYYGGLLEKGTADGTPVVHCDGESIPLGGGGSVPCDANGKPVVFEKSKILAEDVATVTTSDITSNATFSGGTATITSWYQRPRPGCEEALRRWLNATRKWDDDADKGYPGQRADIDHTPYQLSREAVLCNPRFELGGTLYRSCEDLKPERIAAVRAFSDLMGADIDAMLAAKRIAYEACLTTSPAPSK